MPRVSDTPPPGVTPFAPPPGYQPPSAPSAPAPVQIQQGARPGPTPTTLPTLPPEGTKPFLNPPSHPVSEIRAPTWGDVFTPENILYKTLGIEPGSPQQGLQVASKVVPMIAAPAVQKLPKVSDLGAAAKGAVTGLVDFLGTGGDPVATTAGAAGGYLGGLIKSAFSDANRTTRFWTGLGEAIEKEMPNLAPGIRAIGNNPTKLAGYEGRRALQEAASAPFDAAMNRIEGRMGYATPVDLRMPVEDVAKIGIPVQMGPNGWPTATFQEIREAIVRHGPSRNRELRLLADRVEDSLTTHLGTNTPALLPVYEKAIRDYRKDMDILREVVALQEMREMPGGSIREDTPRGIVKAIDKIARPQSPTPPTSLDEGIVSGAAGMVAPRTTRAIKSLLSPRHSVAPIEVPTPQRVNLGKWLGAGASEIPAFINAQIPTEDRPRMLVPGAAEASESTTPSTVPATTERYYDPNTGVLDLSRILGLGHEPPSHYRPTPLHIDRFQERLRELERERHRRGER